MSVRTFALALGLCATALASPVLAHPSPRHGAPPAQCKQEDRPWQRSYDNIVDAFATFDAATSPPAAGAPADVVLADWLAYLDDHVAFEAGNAPTLIGRLAVASYFAPLLPAIGSTRHELRTISPLCGVDNAWVVRGVLHDRYVDPARPYWGVGKLARIARWVDTSSYANEFLRRFFVNGATSAGPSASVGIFVKR